MVNNLITIGLPFYNNENTLNYAIESILAQSYTNWILILINDGSTDNSSQIAFEYASKYENIIFINDHQNKGLIFRLNQIVELTDSEFLARMDADDIMLPSRIEKQLSILLSNAEYDVVSSGAYIINHNNEITGIRDCENLERFIFKDLFFKSYIIHPSAIFKTSWIKRNLYSEGYFRAEDLELWCRTFHNLKLFRIPEPLLFYREGKVNVNNYVSSMLTKIKIIDKYAKNKLSMKSVIYLKLITYFKILSYSLFGIINLQQFLTSFRNKAIILNSLRNETDYLNSLKQHKK